MASVYNSLNSWFNRVRGTESSYQQLSNPLLTHQLPGAYPQDDLEANYESNQESISPEPGYQGTQTTNTSSRVADLAYQWLRVLVFKPLVFVLVVAFHVALTIVKLIYCHNPLLNGLTNSSTADTHPIDKVSKFILKLEDNLSPEQISRGNALPPFFQGSYTQALYMATHRAKFLFVYLANPTTEGSSILFRKIITNPEFIALCRSDQVLIWGGDLTNSEAYQLANSLNVTKFPFLGLLCLTRKTTMSLEGAVKSAPKISLVSKIQGGLSDETNESELIQNKFVKKIAKYQEELDLIKMELRDKFLSQLLQDQQELNYKKSLAQDRAKKRAKEYEVLKKQYLVYRLPHFLELKSREAAGQEAAKVAIRMPDGTRSTLQFPANDPVEVIFEYVELSLNGYFDKDISAPSITDAEAAHKFKNFKMKYSFKLSSPMPPRVSLNEKREFLIKEIDVIFPNGLLIVEDQ